MRNMSKEEALENVKGKRSYLEFLFQKSYSKWKGNYSDDRGLFCNLYEELNEMLDDLEKCSCISMFVAFSEYEKKEHEIMLRIQECFGEKTMVPKRTDVVETTN